MCYHYYFDTKKLRTNYVLYVFIIFENINNLKKKYMFSSNVQNLLLGHVETRTKYLEICLKME